MKLNISKLIKDFYRLKKLRENDDDAIYIARPLSQSELESAIVSNYANYKDRSEEFRKWAEAIEKMTRHKS